MACLTWIIKQKHRAVHAKIVKNPWKRLCVALNGIDYLSNTFNTLFTPQNTWADVQKYDVTYLKLEEDNTQIYEEMGLNNFKLPQINTFMSPVEAMLDPSHPRAKGTSVENYKNLLEDRDLVKRVEETYSKDLEILGYDSLL